MSGWLVLLVLLSVAMLSRVPYSMDRDLFKKVSHLSKHLQHPRELLKLHDDASPMPANNALERHCGRETTSPLHSSIHHEISEQLIRTRTINAHNAYTELVYRYPRTRSILLDCRKMSRTANPPTISSALQAPRPFPSHHCSPVHISLFIAAYPTF